MKQYKDLLRHIMEHGEERVDRTGVGTRSVFGWQSRYNLQDGFPLVTLKFTSLKTILKELVWYLRGEGNIRFLRDNGVKIWDAWADETGDLKRVYGVQWRGWQKFDIVSYGDYIKSGDRATTTYYDATVKVTEIDQIAQLVHDLKSNPASRRHIVSAWNVADLDNMALPPCHSFFQFHVSPSGKLSCQLYQRSADAPIGVPYNIACYAALTHILAKVCGYEVGDFIHSIGDAHIYLDQMDAVKEMLNREPLSLPKLVVPSELSSIDQLVAGEINWDDFKLIDYKHHPKIDIPVAV